MLHWLQVASIFALAFFTTWWVGSILLYATPPKCIHRLPILLVELLWGAFIVLVLAAVSGLMYAWLRLLGAL